MTHPALAALQVARDAELLASDAAAHDDSETWVRESLRAQTILACEVEVDMGRWVRRTHCRVMRTPTLIGTTSYTSWRLWHETVEWSPLEWSRSPYWSVDRSVADFSVLDVQPEPIDFNSLGLSVGNWITLNPGVVEAQQAHARIERIESQGLTLDVTPSRRTARRELEDKERGRAFLESLRSHRRRRGA